MTCSHCTERALWSGRAPDTSRYCARHLYLARSGFVLNPIRQEP
jgi:hypothetical protein